jgi:xanthine/CO dehydrogenase XdhC/CoxF family maturation factor
VAWDLGLGCDGAVDVFIQPAMGASVDEASRETRRCLDGQAAFAVATAIEGVAHPGCRMVLSAGDRVAGSTGDDDLDGEIASAARGRIPSGTSARTRIGRATVFIEVLTPPPRLLVVGAGDDAMPLVDLAARSGFRVTVIDHREAMLAPERFPLATRVIRATHDGAPDGLLRGGTTFAVVMTHALARDRDWVGRLLGGEVSYIGLLGPRARTAEILDALGATGEPRIFGPVGLDLGADGPEQVALSVVSELLAVHRRRRPGHLRDREGPIREHGP